MFTAVPSNGEHARRHVASYPTPPSTRSSNASFAIIAPKNANVLPVKAPLIKDRTVTLPPRHISPSLGHPSAGPAMLMLPCLFEE